MKKLLILLFGATLLLSACNRASVEAAPQATKTASVLPPLTETVSFTKEATATKEVTATSLPSLTPTFTASPMPTPTWVMFGPKHVIFPILLYHRIDISPINSQYYVEPEKFEEQMKLLHDWEYTPVTTDMLVEAIKNGIELPPRPVIITFDDGHLDNYTTAFPIMQKYGFIGVLYIVGNYMGADGYMNPAQIREMADAGWEVGSHSMNHFDLQTLDEESQYNEIVASREKLESEIGVPVRTFAYPFGLMNDSAGSLVHEAGYVAAMGLGYTHDQGSGNLFFLQRRDIKGTYDMKQFAAFLPWQGDSVYLPTETPTWTPTPSRTPIPTYTQYPTKTPQP